jgi:ATP-dependent exoDNAse (exonuclease V) beta subunit
VTTWNKSLFPKFDADAVIANIMKGRNWNPENKYWGQTPEQIKASWFASGASVAGAGTDLHEQIERFMNNTVLPTGYSHRQLLEHYRSQEDTIERGPEWQFFLKFVEENPDLKPYRTEWMIYHEDVKIAGSIDMVYENPDGSLSIYDWKRSKDITSENTWNKFALNPLVGHIPDTNFWHYAMQLNTYKYILEEKYGKRIQELNLVRIHPDHPGKTYELISVPIMTREMIDLFSELKKKSV